jgi:hypothetical protein
LPVILSAAKNDMTALAVKIHQARIWYNYHKVRLVFVADTLFQIHAASTRRSY